MSITIGPGWTPPLLGVRQERFPCIALFGIDVTTDSSPELRTDRYTAWSCRDTRSLGFEQIGGKDAGLEVGPEGDTWSLVAGPRTAPSPRFIS